MMGTLRALPILQGSSSTHRTGLVASQPAY